MDTGIGTAAPAERSGLAPERVFLAISALLFIASAGGTIYLVTSLSEGMGMANGPAMPGPAGLGAAALFMGMWVVMMVAMMLPSLVPTLIDYRRWMRRQGLAYMGGPTIAAGAAYFLVWTVFGAAACLLTLGVGAAEMQSMDLAGFAPVAAGVVVLLAGGFQLTGWKAHQLGCCRVLYDVTTLSPDVAGAWRYGIRLGLHCALCCAGFMTVLLVTGMMSLAIMAVVAAAITLERLAPGHELVARLSGVAMLGAGALMVGRALGVV